MVILDAEIDVKAMLPLLEERHKPRPYHDTDAGEGFVERQT